VYVVEGDTDLCPYGFGNFSSRSLTTGGGAALLAAREVKARLAAAAAALLEASADEIEFRDGVVGVRGAPDRRLTLVDLAGQIYRRSFAIPGIDEPLLEATRTDRPNNYQYVPDAKGRFSAYPTFPYSAHLSTVEVDRETGVVKVLSYSAVGDCGTIISPTFVDSQLYGGIAMGIGGALWEELVYDERGQPRSPSFKEYMLPRAPDLPTIRAGHQVTPSPFTTLGTKGAGESGVGGGVASIANAVNDALAPLGVAVNDMPLTAPKLVRAILAGGQR
jgi:carbon-monoxide dehydrogenase large subunit